MESWESDNQTSSLEANFTTSTAPTASDFFNHGLENFNRGDYRGALADFNLALRLNPDLADAYLYRGIIRSEKADYLGAIQDYSQVLRINPNHAEAYSNRGLIRTLLGDRWGAMQDYNQALQFDSTYIQAYLNRSLMRVELQDYQGAIADCNEILNMNSYSGKGSGVASETSDSFTSDWQALAYLNRGLAHFELEDYQTAMNDYNQALQINPNRADIYFNRGLSRIALGEYQEAISDFNQALKLNPEDAQIYLNRGYIRMQLGDHWGSIEDFDQALRLEPSAAKVFFNQMTDTLNDELSAIEDKNQQLAQGLIIRGNLRYELGDYQAALEAFTQALSLDPNNIEAYNRRSTVRSALGDYQGAIDDLKQVSNLSLSRELYLPSTPVTTIELTTKDYYQRGVDKLQNGDFQGAIADFDRVLEMDTKEATAFTCRGFAYRRLGNDEKAVEDLEAAARLFYEQGDIQSSQEIVETLKKLRP
jgi:serine/threonine-protein kinase